MNNYNDYYNYLNNGFDGMNYIPNPNNMMPNINNTNAFQNTFMMPNNSQNITTPYKGFQKGNMFDNLYDEYKNYKPTELKATSEREDMLLQIRELNFAKTDLNLYLDLYPNDKTALNLFNTYLREEKNLCNEYEKKYGPLTLGSPVQTNNWLWDNSPWPWEVQK